MAEPGEHYLVYLPDGGEVTVELSSCGLTANWIDPRTGNKTEAGTLAAGEVFYKAPGSGDMSFP